MVKPKQRGKTRPRLVFRSRKVSADGEQWIEERELLDCTPEQLMEYLCAPWENFPEPERPDSGSGAKQSIEDWVRTLCVRVSETRDEQGRRQFKLWFEPADSNSQTTASDQMPGQAASGSKLHGNATMRLLEGETTERRGVGFGDATGRIEIHNQGMLVVNRDNTYAIVNIDVQLNLGAPD